MSEALEVDNKTEIGADLVLNLTQTLTQLGEVLGELDGADEDPVAFTGTLEDLSDR